MAGCVTDAVDISRAEKIKGFMHASELTWLAQQAKTHGRIAEVGAYYGRSTRALCDNAAGEVHTFDDWWGPRDIALDWRTRGIIFDIFKDNLKDHIASAKLIVHQGDHKDIKPLAQYFDFIFIDGSHEYFDFKRDLEIWIPALAEGGIISGHDYDLSYPGILQALLEVFGQKCFSVVPETTVWYAIAKGAE